MEDELGLEPIKKRLEAAQQAEGEKGAVELWVPLAVDLLYAHVLDDIPSLIAEIERLRVRVDDLEMAGLDD